MQLGFVGLGKMGGNMVHRIHRDSDHQVVAFDFSDDAVKAAEGHGATGAGSLEELVSKLEAPRTVWVMVPAGDPTEQTVKKLGELLDAGDTIVDGGNTNWHDDVRRAGELDAKGIHYIDVGTSGGVWGLEVGYCMMVGGHEESVQRLAPILDTLAPPDGWRHFGDAGAGHFVKMVHNGVEYGIMQAYAEGFDLMHESRFPIDLKEVAGLWNRGSVVRSWLCELAERAFEARGQRPRGDPRATFGLRRGPLDDHRRDRPRRAGAGDHRGAVRALLLARQRRLHQPRAGGAAQPVRRPRRRAHLGRRLRPRRRRRGEEENPLVEGLERLPVPATTLVIFGATGDLARRKLLPAIYNLAHEGALPERFNLIGVSRRDQSDDEFRDFARESIKEFSRREADATVLEGLLERLSYIGFSFDDQEGYGKLAKALDGLEGEGHPLNRAFYLSTAPEFFGVITSALKEAKLNYRRECDVRVIIEKPFGTDLESARELQKTVVRRPSASSRSTASITTWARRRSRT